MGNNLQWVILAGDDVSIWRTSTDALTQSLSSELPLLVKHRTRHLKKDQCTPLESPDTEYRFWVHFGGDGLSQCFDREKWKETISKSFDNDATPERLLNAEFAPYSVQAGHLDWQRAFWELAPRVKRLMAGEKPVEHDPEALHQILLQLWADAMSYRDWGRKRDALFEAAIVLRQTALLIKLSTESNGIDLNGLDLNPEKERFDKALKHLEEVTEESEKKWFLAMKVLNWPGEGDDVVAFAKKLLNAADSLVANVPPEPKGNTDE